MPYQGIRARYITKNRRLLATTTGVQIDQKMCLRQFLSCRKVRAKDDLPTIVLYTDKQVNDIVKFCCHQKQGMVSGLGADIPFQLGPFYLLVTTYKHTFFNVKGSDHSPSLMGPAMICMTKEESTYLSFLHCLLREVPGLSQYLHAYGTDNEAALVNALAAAFPNGKGLLCYIHIRTFP